MNRIYRPAALVFCVGILAGCSRTVPQPGIAICPQPYLGLAVPADSAQRLAPDIIATDQHEHSALAVSDDLTRLFWSVIPVPLGSGRQDIFTCHWNGEAWTAPSVLPFTVDANCGSPVIRPGEEALYYIKRHPTEKVGRWGRQMLMRTALLDSGRLGEPKEIIGVLPQVDGRLTMRMAFAESGAIYYDVGGPDEKGVWSWEIWRRPIENGQLGEPEMLPASVNGSRINWTPYVAPDESFIVFSSDRMNNGDVGDLYIVYKEGPGQWTEAVALEAVNTFQQERFPALTPDGRALVFARNIPETFSDLLWIDAAFLKPLQTN